jgi:hypothetical protein
VYYVVLVLGMVCSAATATISWHTARGQIQRDKQRRQQRSGGGGGAHVGGASNAQWGVLVLVLAVAAKPHPTS